MQTDKDLLRLLDAWKRKSGKDWTALAKRAGISPATPYRWFSLPTNVYLDKWLDLMNAAGAKVMLRTKDGQPHAILAANGTLNTAVLNREAERKGIKLYRLTERASGKSNLIYMWATKTFPTLRNLVRILNALDIDLIAEAKA